MTCIQYISLNIIKYKEESSKFKELNIFFTFLAFISRNTCAFSTSQKTPHSKQFILLIYHLIYLSCIRQLHIFNIFVILLKHTNLWVSSLRKIPTFVWNPHKCIFSTWLSLWQKNPMSIHTYRSTYIATSHELFKIVMPTFCRIIRW